MAETLAGLAIGRTMGMIGINPVGMDAKADTQASAIVADSGDVAQIRKL